MEDYITNLGPNSYSICIESHSARDNLITEPSGIIDGIVRVIRSHLSSRARSRQTQVTTSHRVSMA